MYFCLLWVSTLTPLHNATMSYTSYYLFSTDLEETGVYDKGVAIWGSGINGSSYMPLNVLWRYSCPLKALSIDEEIQQS